MTISQSCIFIDRDGVINEDHNYVHRWEDFHFIDGVVDALVRLKAAGYYIVVVTNQSGIGRGFFTDNDFHILSEKMLRWLQQRSVQVDAIYHCPHLPQDNCACRKPAPGMILQAAREHNLDLSSSYIIGDKLSDIEAGQRANVGQQILVGPSAGRDHRGNRRHLEALNLHQAANIILSGVAEHRG